jgi:hypothetical protein
MTESALCDLGDHGRCTKKHCDCWCHVKRGIEGQSAMIVAAEDALTLLDQLSCNHVLDESTVTIVNVTSPPPLDGFKFKQIRGKCKDCGREGVLCELPDGADIEW